MGDTTVSDRIGPVGHRGDGGGNDDDVARLVRRAASRPAIPTDTADRVHAAVHAAWERSKRRQRPARVRRRQVWALAAAAAVVLTLIGVRIAFRRDAVATADTLARVEQVLGGSNVGPGDSVVAEQWLITEADGLLTLGGGWSIRLAPDSRARFLSAATVELDRGAVYVDSGARSERSGSVVVATAFGRVAELGTRFLVRVDEQKLQVRVRDGSVAVGEGHGRHEAHGGTELTVDATGRASLRQVPVFGPDWDWVLRAAPAPRIDRRPLTELLDWVGREGGWAIEFRDEQARTRVLETVLHGDVDGLTPEEALAATLPTCGLVHAVESGRLVLEVSAGNETR